MPSQRRRCESGMLKKDTKTAVSLEMGGELVFEQKLKCGTTGKARVHNDRDLSVLVI